MCTDFSLFSYVLILSETSPTMKKLLFLSICFVFSSTLVQAQVMAVKDSEAAKTFEKEYQKNIKLSKINGVYIPSSLDEAFNRLEKLSPPASIAKFQTGEELIVAEKLHFGIGRWMMVNWNFYGGSRLSHLLKQKGVMHPDDMAQFVLRSFHRKLNNKPLEENALVEELVLARKKTTQEVLGFQTKDNHE